MSCLPIFPLTWLERDCIIAFGRPLMYWRVQEIQLQNVLGTSFNLTPYRLEGETAAFLACLIERRDVSRP